MIRKAVKSDLDAVVNIYDEIHQAEEAGIISVGWIRGIYPVKETAEEALKRDDLFVIEKDGIVLGSGIINKVQMDIYNNVKWEHEVEDDKVCAAYTCNITSIGKDGTRQAVSQIL